MQDARLSALATSTPVEQLAGSNCTGYILSGYMADNETAAGLIQSWVRFYGGRIFVSGHVWGSTIPTGGCRLAECTVVGCQWTG